MGGTARRLAAVGAAAIVASGCSSGQNPALEAPPPAAATPPLPVLKVLLPEPGGTITVPFELRYQVAGFDVGDPPRGHLHAIWGEGAGELVEVPLPVQVGTVEVGGIPEGRRDLRLTLARADHSPVENPEATVLLAGSTFVERGSGGGALDTGGERG